MNLRLIVTFVSLYLIQSNLFAQCAMCKAVVESDAGLAKGVNDGILYLMAIPYILLVIVGYFVYQHYKKNKSDV